MAGGSQAGYKAGYVRRFFLQNPEFRKRRMEVGGRKRRKGKKGRREPEKRDRYLETVGSESQREMAQRVEAAESLFPRSRWCEPCWAGWRYGL